MLENFRSYLWRNYKWERQDNFTSLHFFKIKQGKSKVVNTPHDNNSFLDKSTTKISLLLFATWAYFTEHNGEILIKLQ